MASRLDPTGIAPCCLVGPTPERALRLIDVLYLPQTRWAARGWFDPMDGRRWRRIVLVYPTAEELLAETWQEEFHSWVNTVLRAKTDDLKII